MTVTRKNFDIVFSQLVRERASHRCENCGSYENPQCAHVFGRIRYTVRCDDRNAYCLCASCHYFFTNDPVGWGDFVIDKMGRKEYDALRLISNQPMKFGRTEKADMVAHLRAELKKMRQTRSEGVVGRIDFRGWRV